MKTGIEVLQSSELFEALTKEELIRVVPSCSNLEAKEGRIIFTEGREAEYLFLVAEGKIALQKAIRAPHAKHSRRTTVTLCSMGQVAGWSALVPPYKYTLSAIAWERCDLVSIDSALLRKVLELHPEMGYKIMRALSEIMSKRLKQTTDRVYLYGGTPAVQL